MKKYLTSSICAIALISVADLYAEQGTQKGHADAKVASTMTKELNKSTPSKTSTESGVSNMKGDDAANHRLNQLKKSLLEDPEGIEAGLRQLSGLGTNGATAGERSKEQDRENFLAPSGAGDEDIRCVKDGKIVAAGDPSKLNTSIENWLDKDGKPIWPRVVTALEKSGDTGVSVVVSYQVAAKDIVDEKGQPVAIHYNVVAEKIDANHICFIPVQQQ